MFRIIFKNIQVGDIVSIYPIHSCLTANLMQAYILDNGDVLEHFSSGAPFRARIEFGNQLSYRNHRRFLGYIQHIKIQKF